MAKVRIVVSGKVQGVGYRYFTQMKASIYDIKGWVKNSEDGKVELVATGRSDDLDAFVRSIQEGNPFSKVTSLDITPLEDTESFSSFKIRY